MRKPYAWLFASLVLFGLILAGCSFNLAGDVTPPPGWKPTPVPPTPDMSSLYPALPPDPVAGKHIYQQACAVCHGDDGMGNGPQAASLPSAPAALAAPDELRAAVPAERFLVVTEGDVAHGMPPFANTLTARQRWDVLAYIYTLGTAPQTLAQGQALYEQRCLECHGSRGLGHDLASQKRLAQTSDAELFDDILGDQHTQEVYQGLSDDDRWALVAYIRSLSFARTSETTATASPEAPTATPAAETPAAGETTPTPAATETTAENLTPTPTSVHGTLTITGQVTNGTAGASLPPDLQVTLYGYDEMQEAYSATTTVDAEGKFVFHDVPNAPNRVFFATAEYQNVIYGSRGVTAPPGKDTLDMPFSIYETTTDHSTLQVDRLHVFASLNGDQMLEVVEIYVITNTGDKTVVGKTPDDPVLVFDLPAGAMNLQFQDGVIGGRYIQTAHGFGDLMPVYPQHTAQEVFAYDLPFEGKRLEVSHPVPLPVAAAVLMVPEGELSMSGDRLVDNGVQSDSQGSAYHVYNMDALAAGENLTFTVERVSAGLSLTGNSKTSLAIGLMAIGAALIAVAVVLFKRPAPEEAEAEPPLPASPDDAPEQPAEAEDPETLMDAILALDDLYQEGKIAEEVYQKRRALLKARLKRALEAKDKTL